MRRIHFTAWGSGKFRAPAYAMSDGCSSDEDCVARAIARATSKAEGRRVVACSVQTDGRRGDGEKRHYVITLGYPCGGGITPMAEVRIQLVLLVTPTLTLGGIR